MTLGDSKTASGTWQPILVAALSALGNRSWQTQNAGRGGATAASYAAQVDSIIAGFPDAPSVALVNLGTNDIGDADLPAQGTWEQSLGYTLDAVHAAYPGALVYVTKPCRAGYDAKCNTVAGWVDNVVAARTPWAAVGDDERVWLIPNNAAYTYDGLHYNPAGDAAKASAAQAVMGY